MCLAVKGLDMGPVSTVLGATQTLRQVSRVILMVIADTALSSSSDQHLLLHFPCHLPHQQVTQSICEPALEKGLVIKLSPQHRDDQGTAGLQWRPRGVLPCKTFPPTGCRRLFGARLVAIQQKT